MLFKFHPQQTYVIKLCVSLIARFESCHLHAVSHGQALLREAEPDNPVCLAGSEQEETGGHYLGRSPTGHVLHLTHETCSTAVW